MAARWAEVTELELAFAQQRDERGTTAATLALAERLRAEPAQWVAECLAVAVAALDDVRWTGQLPRSSRDERGSRQLSLPPVA